MSAGSAWARLLKLLGMREGPSAESGIASNLIGCSNDPLAPLSLEELEDWIIEKGDAVIQRQALYPEHVTAEEQLVYCLWCVDYGMRNAGDLQPAFDIKHDVMDKGRSLSSTLALPRSEAFFTLPVIDAERQYFDKFEEVCSEIEAAYQAMLERQP